MYMVEVFLALPHTFFSNFFLFFLRNCVLGVFVGNFFGLWLGGIAGESPKNMYGQKSTEPGRSCNGV